MPDLASLGVKIDTSDVRKGVIDLQKLSKAEQDAYLDSSRLKDSFKKTGNEAKKLGNQNRITAQQTKGLSSSFGALGSAIGVLGLAGMARSVFEVNKNFQTLKASLTTVTGSATEAEKAFSGIQSFASQTPFTVEKITQSFIKLKSLGLDASAESLRSYGNTASAMGKSLNQVIEAIADASTNEFERLKEFGIKARQEGENVKFTFQGITTTVGKNANEIQAYLKSIGDVNFAGGMERQMNTINGSLSNLADAWSQFADNVLSDSNEASIAGFINGFASALKNLDTVFFSSMAMADKFGITLKTGFQAIVLEVQAAFKSMVQSAMEALASFTSSLANGADAIGLDSLANSLRHFAVDVTPGVSAADELKQKLAELGQESLAQKAVIDNNVIAYIKYNESLTKNNKLVSDSSQVIKKAQESEKDKIAKINAHNKLLQQGESLRKSLLTQEEKNNEALEKASRLYEAGAISVDTYNKAVKKHHDIQNQDSNKAKQELQTNFNQELAGLIDYNNQLSLTEREYYKTTLAADGFTDSMQQQLLVEYDHIKVLESQKASMEDMQFFLSDTFNQLLADGESFTKNLGDMFDSMIDRMLNAAVEFASSQVIRGLFSGNYGQALSGLGVGVAAIAGSYLASDSSAPDRPRASRTTSQGDDRALGYQQQIAADIQSRDYFYAAQLQQFRELQTYVGVQTQLIKQGLSPYTDQLQSFFFDSSNYLTDTINHYLPDSVKDVISGITDSISSFSQNSGLNDFANTDIQSYMVDGIVNSFSPQSFDAIGTMFQSGVQTAFSGPTMTQSIANSITPAFESGIGQAGNQISQAVSDSIPSSFSELSSSNATSATNNLGAVTGVLTSIYGVYSLINGWSEMSTSEKVINALGTVTSVVSAGASATAALASAAGSAISAGAQTVLAAIPVVGWVVAGIVNVYQTVEKALAGQRASAVDQVLTGGLGGMIENWLGMDQGEAVEAGTFGLIKNRVPNAWLETQRLAGGINDTPEGFERFSSNDPFFSHTGNKDARVGVNTAFGRTQFSTHELEQTQEEIRELFAPALGLIRDVDTNVANAINNIETAAGGVGETMAFYRNYLDAGNIINFNQEIESLDAAELIAQRYGSIADVLGQSGTRLGVAVDSWFDILSKSFGAEYGAEIFNLVGTNIESFAEIPVTITNLIQDRLKAPDIGGTADDAVKEVFSVLNAYSQLQTTIRGLGEENISDEVIAGFLVDINSVGFSVEEAGESLSLYAKVLYLAGEDITAGMNDLVAMSEEMTNADFSQFISTVGQLTALSQSLGLSTTINDLKSISTIIGDIAQTTLDTAALDEAQEYGGGAARAQLESMGIATADAMLKVVNEIMFLNNTLTFFDSSLADVGFRMDATLVKFSSGLIEVMGGLEEASATFDRLARGFLSTSAYSDYAKQNLRFTADQLKEQLERPDLNFNNFWREFGEAITPESDPEIVKTWSELGDVLIGINDLTEQGNQARQQEAETRRQQIDADREAAAQLKASQDSFMAGINESLRRFDMTDFELSLDDLSLRFNDLNSEAHELGLTTDQLSEITALQAKEEEKLLAARQESLSKFSDLINATGSLLNLDPSGVNVGNLSYGLGGIDRATELISRFTEGFFSDLEQQGTAAEQAAKKAAAGIARLNFPGLTQDTFADIFTNLLATGEMTTDVLEGWLTVGDAILDAQEASEQLVATLAGQFKDLQTESETSFKTQLDYISNIRDYVDSLKTNSQLSPLTNAQQFGESRAQFNTQLAAARAGDTDALQNITRFADTYLQNAQGYLSSSSAYTDIFNDVSAALLSISDSVITEQSDGTIISNSILDQTLALIDESKASTTQVIDALKQAFTNEELDSSGIFLQLFNDKLASNGLEGLVTAQNYAEQLGIYSKEAFIPAVNANLANDLTALYNEAFPNQVLDTFVIATEEIRSFLGGNPASQHIYEAAILNNTSIEQIAVAVGTSSDKIIDWFERFGHDVSKLLQGENFTPTPAVGLTDQNILDYIATGPTPTQLYDTATEFGVSANRLGGLLSTVDPNLNTLAVNAYADSLGRPQLYNESAVTPGPAVPESLLTDQNIRDFVNSSTSLMEVYRGAAENGITIERLARNFEGIDVDAINNFIQGAGLDPLTSEYVRATSPTPEGVLTDQNIRDYIYDPATDLLDVYKKALEHGLTAQRVARNWDGIDAAFINNWTKEQGLGSLPRFAQGGITSGPSIAGEDGVEAVIPIPSGEVKARVTGNDNRELLAEMKALREEVKMLREQQPEHTQAVIDSNYDANEQASERIVNATNKQTNANRHRKMAIA